MFSGIVETTGQIVASSGLSSEVVRIRVRPREPFLDIKRGDSICVDGVCLTVEEFDAESFVFALGQETLQVTEWQPDKLLERTLNLERSLRFQDRVHGHLVTGHVDARATILAIGEGSESRTLNLQFPPHLRAYIWPKGSVALNGVSLTVNRVLESTFEVGLIPETLRQTNLRTVGVGDGLNLEVDNMARGLVHIQRLQQQERLNS